MKSLFSLIFILQTLPALCFNQDTIITYWNKKGKEVQELDSAEVIRKVFPAAGSEHLFEVREYYSKQIPKLEGTVSKHNPVLHFEGLVKRFSKKGIIVEEINYKDNKFQGEAKFYYENGALREVLDFYDAPNTLNPHGAMSVHSRMIAYFDSLGNQQVKDGNGFATKISESFIEKGNYVDGFKDGTWTGNSRKSEWSYVESFENGKFISGKSVYNGKTIPYDQQEEQPEYPGGIMQFYQSIGQNYRYPREAQRTGVTGNVVVSFVVEKDGSLSDLRILRELGFGTGEEAIRVVKKSPAWIPGKHHGVPVRVQYTLPIRLNLSR